MLRLTGALLWLAMCLVLGAAAQLAIPPLTARVTDLTSTLTPAQRATLERSLQDFEARKGSQVSVLIVSSTAPEAIEQYSVRVVEQWKLGRKKVDDGALLIVAKDDRTMRIEVGYGLEGVLNDAVSKRIISEVITPKFKRGDFYGGISDGIGRMMLVIEGEPLPAPAPAAPGGDSSPSSIGTYFPFIVILALVVGAVLRSLLGRVPGAVASGGIVALFVWMVAGVVSITVFAGVLALVFTLFGAGMHGAAGRHYGGGFGGRGGGFHGGGGGFGGRGGSFGGGGASGRW